MSCNYRPTAILVMSHLLTALCMATAIYICSNTKIITVQYSTTLTTLNFILAAKLKWFTVTLNIFSRVPFG